MQTIDVETSQNVPLTFELASIMERIGAFLLDLLIIVVVQWILGMMSSTIDGIDARNLFTYLIQFPFFIFYSLGWEIFNKGASPGKSAVGIRVIRLSTYQNDVSGFLLRWVFRGLDIYFSAGTLAALFINASSKKQRLGDLLGNTAVVRTRSKFKVRINDLERLEKKDDFIYIFPEIKRMREEDILLVREVIDRSKKYSGREQELLLSETRAKIEQIIGKAPVNMDDLTYLAKVVKEYVMMTR